MSTNDTSSQQGDGQVWGIVVDDPGPIEILPPSEHPDVASVLEAHGVELGTHDRRTAAWVQRGDSLSIVPIASWIRRAYAAGLRNGLSYAEGIADGKDLQAAAERARTLKERHRAAAELASVRTDLEEARDQVAAAHQARAAAEARVAALTEKPTKG